MTNLFFYSGLNAILAGQYDFVRDLPILIGAIIISIVSVIYLVNKDDDTINKS